MSDYKFPGVFSLYKPSWEGLKLNIGTFALQLLAAIGVPAAVALVAVAFRALAHQNSAVINVVLLIAGVVSVLYTMFILAPASQYVALKSAGGVKVSFKESFDKGKHFAANFFVLNLFVGLLVIGGLILLIVPGILMLKRYLLANYFLLDKDLRPTEAMRQATAASKQFSDVHWGLLGLQGLLTVVGYIPFVGTIISLIMSVMYCLAYPLRYVQIKAAPSPASSPAPNPAQ